jgi:hypothetical protein
MQKELLFVMRCINVAAASDGTNIDAGARVMRNSFFCGEH